MKSLLRVLGYLKPYKKAVSLTLVFATLTTLLDLIPPWIIKIIIDRLIEDNGTPMIPAYPTDSSHIARQPTKMNWQNRFRLGMSYQRLFHCLGV